MSDIVERRKLSENYQCWDCDLGDEMLAEIKQLQLRLDQGRVADQCILDEAIKTATKVKDAEIERLRAVLAVFIHAWQTSNNVPPHIEAEAIELCEGWAWEQSASFEDKT